MHIKVLGSGSKSNFKVKVKPRWISNECLSYSAFGDGKASKGNVCNVYDLTLIDIQGNCHSLIASAIPDICAPLFRPCVPSEIITEFSSLQLVDDYMNNRNVNVDILIGLNAYWQFISPDGALRCGNVVAQDSVFGWVLSGVCNASINNNPVWSLCVWLWGFANYCFRRKSICRPLQPKASQQK